jgi:hypothetical protein
MEFIQDIGLNLGAKLLGGITEAFRQDSTVAFGPRTSEHTSYFHNSSYHFSLESFFQFKLATEDTEITEF